MDKILYFPYVSVPKTPWLNRAILYWDEVGSIVPMDYIDRPDNLDPYMRELVEAELIKQVIPGMYISDIPRFGEAFLRFIEESPVVKEFANNRRRSIYRQNYIKIHMEKLDNIAYELIDMGLAEKAEGPWYKVEPFTGYNFMSYLATVLAAVVDYQASTDNIKYFSNFACTENIKFRELEIKERLRVKVLDNILPAPIQISNVNELVEFKEKYNKELIRFRNHIEEFIMDLELVPEQQRNERIERFKVRSQDDIDYITEKMREHRWQFLDFGSLCSIASSIIPLAKSVALKDMSQSVEAIPGLLGAVSSALDDKHLENLRRYPLAYAMYVNQNIRRLAR